MFPWNFGGTSKFCFNWLVKGSINYLVVDGGRMFAAQEQQQVQAEGRPGTPQRAWDPPKGWGPPRKGLGPPRSPEGGVAKISRFFFSSPTIIFILVSWNFSGVMKAGTLKCARLEYSGCRVKPQIGPSPDLVGWGETRGVTEIETVGTKF